MSVNYVTTPERLFVNTARPVFNCVICLKIVDPRTCLQMPWGSDFDGEYICHECAHEHIDPVLHRLIDGRVANAE